MSEVNIVEVLIRPKDTPRGRGLYYNTYSKVLFVGSRCCAYFFEREDGDFRLPELIEDQVSLAGLTSQSYACMLDGGDSIRANFTPYIRLATYGLPSTTTDSILSEWATYWTGIPDLGVTIDYM